MSPRVTMIVVIASINQPLVSGPPPAIHTPALLMHRQTFLSETLINKLSAAHYYYQLGYESRIGWMEDLEWINYFIVDCPKLFSEFLHSFQSIKNDII